MHPIPTSPFIQLNDFCTCVFVCSTLHGLKPLRAVVWKISHYGIPYGTDDLHNNNNTCTYRVEKSMYNIIILKKNEVAVANFFKKVLRKVRYITKKQLRKGQCERSGISSSYAI